MKVISRWKKAATAAFSSPAMPVLAGILVSGLAVALILTDAARGREREGVRSGETAAAFKASLEGRLDATTRVLLGLKAYALSSGSADQEAFDTFARHLTEGLPEIRSLQLAPGGVVRLVHPLSGNESVIGLDLLSDPVNSPDARRAMESGTSVASGPFPLRQGYSGVVIRMPITADGGGEGRFWGFATVVLDFTEYAERSGLASAPFPLALRNPAAAGSADDFFYGDPGLSGPDLVRTGISIPGGTWIAELRLETDPRLAGPWLVLLLVPAFGFGLFVSALLHELQAGQRRLVREVAERGAREDELRRFESIVSATPDMISMVDHDHRYRMVNDSYTKLFGRPRDFFLGRRIDEALSPQLYETVSRPSIIRAFTGETVHALGRVAGTGGRLRSYSMTYIPVPDADGSIPYVVINGHDITDIEDARTDRQRIFEVSPDLLCMMDRDGLFREVNPSWTRVLGWQSAELEGKPALELVHPEDREGTAAALDSLWEGNGSLELQNRCLAVGGAWRWMSWLFHPDPGRNLAFATVRDITENRELLERLQELVRTDQLTGAATRRAFWERAVLEIGQSRRHGTPLAVCMLDLDHFKGINDGYGHEAGDEALKAAAALCLAGRRTGDMFCRLGGEEFAFMLPHTDLEQAGAFAERIRAGLSSLRITVPGGTVRLTVSIGVALLGPDDSGLDPLLKRADAAMYRAKRDGRDRVVDEMEV